MIPSPVDGIFFIMNFLGHLYFSDNRTDLMYANIFGDFVKGSDLTTYTETVQYGIRLHREIDHYIDTHPAVRTLLHQLYPSLPKIAGIAIDLYFDHLLAKNWSRFHPVPLADFLQTFYGHAIDEAEFPDESFLHMIFRMRHANWIGHYASLEGLERACMGVSRRISFPNALFNGRAVFEEFEAAVTASFDTFMKDAIPHFKTFHSDFHLE